MTMVSLTGKPLEPPTPSEPKPMKYTDFKDELAKLVATAKADLLEPDDIMMALEMAIADLEEDDD